MRLAMSLRRSEDIRTLCEARPRQRRRELSARKMNEFAERSVANSAAGKVHLLLLVLALLLGETSYGLAQRALPFGLTGQVVRDLAVSPGSSSPVRYLYAITETQGVYRRDLSAPYSDWVNLGLGNESLRSVGVCRYGIGPADFEVPLVGTAAQFPGEPLLYAFTDSGWVAVDQGLDPQRPAEVRALACFSSSGHLPPAGVFASVGGSVYAAEAPRFRWKEVLPLGLATVNALALSDPASPCGIVWAGGENATFAPWIARSLDCGDSWQLSFPDMGGDNACDALAAHASRPNVLFAGMEGAVIASHDTGRTWKSTSLRGEPVYFFGLAIDSGRPDHVWAGGRTSPEDHWALWESFDGGATWRPVRTRDATPVRGIARLVSDAAEPGTVYIATLGDGVWVYRNRHSPDAVTLTLRLQESGIFLDEKLADEVEWALAAARTAHDRLAELHALPDYVPDQLIVSCSPSAPWLAAWNRGQVETGYEPIDSLGKSYDLLSVERIGSDLPHFLLTFARPMRVPELARHYVSVPGVITANPNSVAGDGNRIECFRKDNLWHFVFSEGWGDCPSGCLNRRYWYVLVQPDGASQLVQTWEQDFTQPRIHLWNIPARFPATAFQDLEELLGAMASPQWWVRRHAAEVCGLLFAEDEPWLGEDALHRARFEYLREAVRSHRAEVFRDLVQLTKDADPDVRNSALHAINRALGYPADSWNLYFPLSVGNRWIFSEGGMAWSVTESVRLDSFTYFRLNNLPPYGPCLVRFTQDGKLFVKDGDREQLWLDFTRELGKRWPVTDPSGNLAWEVELESRTDTVDTPAGSFGACYRFWFHFRGTDNDWAIWLAPGIGPVKVTLCGFGLLSWSLQSAQIGGMPYPTKAETGTEERTMPRCLGIQAVYPNPGHKEIRVRYWLSRPSEVQVEILDLQGRIVWKSDLGARPPGQHEFVWRGLDGSGGLLPNGIYFLRAQAREGSAVGKMILLR